MATRSLRFVVLALLLLTSLGSVGWSTAGADDATAVASPVASPTVVQHWPSWISIGPSNVILARAVRPDACPQITIDGSTGAMDIRALPTTDHPNVVCETAVPTGSASV